MAVRRKENANALQAIDRPAHDWYRFVLSFPPHLVRQYLDRFGANQQTRLLDPFCGTGTTLVECKKRGIPSVGIEANPMGYFASRVKTDWNPSSTALLRHSKTIADETLSELDKEGIDDWEFFSSRNSSKDFNSLRLLPLEQSRLLLKDSISPLPLHKTLVLLEHIERHSDPDFTDHEKLALAKALVESVGNLHFGPEVGVGKIKEDGPVVSAWLSQVKAMAADLEELSSRKTVPADILQADSRDVASLLEPQSVDIVFTSPPYPNEKDYTRTTRLESVLLGFLKNKKQLRSMKQGLIRSNTRNVYTRDTDHEWVAGNQEIEKIALEIENRRKELGKTSGFERLYHRVTRLYFGGMARHLADLRSILRPGAPLGYVVGDQASYLRVMIRTGQLLAEIAESLGYELVGIDLFRSRFSTVTRSKLREEVVVLRWPGRTKQAKRTAIPSC